MRFLFSFFCLFCHEDTEKKYIWEKFVNKNTKHSQLKKKTQFEWDTKTTNIET